MIDSTHPNFKLLNKAIRDGNNYDDSRNGQSPSSSTSNATNTNTDISGLFSSSNTIGNFNDTELKELLKKKDRRGRPRKFAIEETGVTIKGLELMEVVLLKIIQIIIINNTL